MTTETKRRIKFYTEALPGMKKRTFAALMLLLIAMIVAVVATYAWVTLSYAPEVQNITTTFAANGALEIALAKEDGSMPDEFDIDESVGISRDITVTNLAWGNLVNLSDASYGINKLALRPAQLNSAALLTNPLWSAVYGQDGRVKELDTHYAFARYDGNDFVTSSNTYGVRAIAAYEESVSGTTEEAQKKKIKAIENAHQVVNTVYSAVSPKFKAMGTMISKYGQDKLDNTNTNLAPYIKNMIPLYDQIKEAMEKQMDAYVALANFQNYMFYQNQGLEYTDDKDLTWDDILAEKAQYNAKYDTEKKEFTSSTNGTISLVGLTQFINDYDTLVADLSYLNQYNDDYQTNGTAYYWDTGGVNKHQLNNIVADLIDYGTMTIDLKGNGKEVAVTELGMDNAGDLMAADGQSRNVFTYNGIAIRFEQLAVDENYRLNGNAACTISINAPVVGLITVKGKAYTKAEGSATFTTAYNKATKEARLVANDSVANDTYGMAIDLWFRSNAERTCLTLEGATVADESGNIMAYDGVNRIWGSTGEATLTTDSTTQGGGSCYTYYTGPENMNSSLKLLESMKVAFVDENGILLATASMDTMNYYAVNGRLTVPLCIDNDAATTYTYYDALNQELTGRAITTLYLDHPQRIMAIIYLDGTQLENDDVLAAENIDGQLNIQFGSSETIRTIGDNNLIDDVRDATVTLSKYEMDYDTAVTEDDLTTYVTVHVNGTQPRNVTAHFVLAINASQGTREEEMTFVQQNDGSWISSYRFKAPGDYYLRYVRFDGVEYALHDPQHVHIEGFGLHSIAWGEASDYVEIRTSENTYTVPIYAQFATSDPSKMPQTVSAIFLRGDGNTLPVPLTYSSTDNQWTGTAVFATSETYTLKYLTYDSNYKDVTTLGINKVIKLSLGLYVEVYNGTGAVIEEYHAGNTYSKDLGVKIFDNAGNEITGLTGARLYYANGSSATNTINTDLTWNEKDGWYDGTLPITKAGRYTFSSLQTGNNYLTKCTDSPVYIIQSPNPPEYDNGSQSTYFGGIQFAPMTNDAVIDNIIISDAESARINAVVYNSLANRMFEVDENHVSRSGDNNWRIDLPIYTLDLDSEGLPLENAVYTQEGEWRLILLTLFDCYDDNGVYREENNPLRWSGSGEIVDAYLESASLTADKVCNFYPLTTTVSCTVKMTFVPGTTDLGSGSAPFMSRYPVSSTGMYALLTDEAGNVIPKNKISDVTLTVSYAPPTNSGSYGYKVLSSAAKTYEIRLNAQDAEDGHRTVSEVNGAADLDWQYVGPYNVVKLTATLGSSNLTYTQSDSIGLPNRYTITTAGPAAENITLLDENITLRYTTLGKTGGTVTGTFLQSQDPRVTAKITLITADNSNTQFVILDDVTMQFVMTYKDGKTAPNGGYRWSGTSEYENVTIEMSNNSGTYSTVATPLLSGTYSTQLKVDMGGEATTRTLSDVSVYSKMPTVKIASVSPDPIIKIDMNPDIASEGCYIWNNVKDGLITVQNYKSDFSANVYAGAEGDSTYENSEYNDSRELTKYTLPKISLSATNLGTSFDTATATIGNETDASASNDFVFRSGSDMSDASDVGALGSGSFTVSNGQDGCDAADLPVHYDIYKPAGVQSFNTLSVVKDSTTYVLQLTDTVTIRESNSAPPSISFATSPEGYTTPTGAVSETGESFTFTLPTSIGQQNGQVSVPVDGDWEVSSTATQKICSYSVTEPNPTSYTSGSGCSATTKYKCSVDYTYYKFTKTTTTETVTAGTNEFSIKKGVTGWNIGGVIYSPGQTITVDGVFTATPVIDELPGTRVYLSSIPKTGMRTHTVIASDGTYKKTVSVDGQSSESDARSAVIGKEDTYKPSGYEWYDATNKKAEIKPEDTYTEPVWTTN